MHPTVARVLAATLGALTIPPAMALTLTSPTFSDGASIPVRYTCDGAGLSPPLRWSGASKSVRAFALTVARPDAPDPAHPTRTFAHWVIFNLPPSVSSLGAGIGRALPYATEVGVNGSGRAAWTPPCLPVGRHRYFFRLYALDGRVALGGHPDRAALSVALRGHVLAEAILVGTYAHHD